LSYGAQKIHFMELVCDTIFKRFNDSNESSQILSTIDQSNLSKSFGFRFRNPSGVKKICFVDFFCPTVFKRFVSWIHFVLLCSKDSFCGFVLEKQKTQIAQFILFRKDSCTIPASLKIIHYSDDYTILILVFFFFFVGLWSQSADKLTIHSLPCSWIL
jgi:hypothetical protein